MRKLVGLITLLTAYSLCMAAPIQITNSGGYTVLSDAKYNLDALILLNGIDATTTMTFTGSETIEWRYSVNNETFNSTQNSISPESDILYTIYSEGKPLYYIYTIDYTEYAIEWHSLEVITDEATQCEQVKLHADCVVPDIQYTDKNNTTHILPRTFSLEWTDASWNGTEWVDSSAHSTLTLPSDIVIDAPKRNTTFSLTGDNWITEMGATPDSIQTDYTAIRIECHPKATVIEREYKNEKDRSSESEIEGSGPLNVEITSNANPLDITYYEWFVTSAENPNNYQRYNDENLNYTFEKTGEYNIRLVATSGSCTFSDSINIKVLESYIEAPNVFTPNGDGMNDEWRVAYKSIERYSCIVQNRWGRTVYRSDNPGKGWDGTIGGRPASVGTYYYVIIAYGTDKDLRGKQKKYKLSGDINLLR